MKKNISMSIKELSQVEFIEKRVQNIRHQKQAAHAFKISDRQVGRLLTRFSQNNLYHVDNQ